MPCFVSIWNLNSSSFFAAKVVSSNPADGEVYSIQFYVMKFISFFRKIGDFLRVSSTNKTDCHDIAQILLKVALNTTTLTPNLFIAITADVANLLWKESIINSDGQQFLCIIILTFANIDCFNTPYNFMLTITK